MLYRQAAECKRSKEKVGCVKDREVASRRARCWEVEAQGRVGGMLLWEREGRTLQDPVPPKTAGIAVKRQKVEAGEI